MNMFLAVGLGLFSFLNMSRGALYNGNGNNSFGGAVGAGSLTLTDNGSTVTGTFSKGGSGSFLDVLVIFIDSKAGGFSTTTGFTDSSTRLTRAISGVDGTGNQAVADFASGFSADYAIALRPRSAADPDQLFQLVNGGAHIPLAGVNLDPVGTGSSSTYTFSFNLADIGLTPGPGASFKFESTYIGDTGSRSLESFESLSGDTGWVSVNFGAFDTYSLSLAPVPETTNVALVIFGGVALAAGVFRRLRGVPEREPALS